MTDDKVRQMAFQMPYRTRTSIRTSTSIGKMDGLEVAGVPDGWVQAQAVPCRYKQWGPHWYKCSKIEGREFPMGKIDGGWRPLAPASPTRDLWTCADTTALLDDDAAS